MSDEMFELAAEKGEMSLLTDGEQTPGNSDQIESEFVVVNDKDEQFDISIIHELLNSFLFSRI